MDEAKFMQSRTASTTSSSQGEDGGWERLPVNTELTVGEEHSKDNLSTSSTPPPPKDDEYERLAVKLAGLVESKLLEGFGERLAGIERALGALTTQLQPLFEKLEAERLERERVEELEADERVEQEAKEERRQQQQIIQRQAPPQMNEDSKKLEAGRLVRERFKKRLEREYMKKQESERQRLAEEEPNLFTTTDRLCRSSSPLLTCYAAAADGNNTAGCRRAVDAKLEENDRRMAKEVLQQLRMEHSWGVNTRTLDIAYKSLTLADATRLSLDNFLEQAECVNAKIEALLRVNQLTEIVHRNKAPYFSDSAIWPFPNTLDVYQWYRNFTDPLVSAARKADVVAVYKRFVADLEQRRVKQAVEMQNEVEYFALITYDFPDKFSEAPASG